MLPHVRYQPTCEYFFCALYLSDLCSSSTRENDLHKQVSVINPTNEPCKYPNHIYQALSVNQESSGSGVLDPARMEIRRLRKAPTKN